MSAMARSTQTKKELVRLSVAVPARLAVLVGDAAAARRQAKQVLYEEALRRLFDDGSLSLALGKQTINDLEVLAGMRSMSPGSLVAQVIEAEIAKARIEQPDRFAVQQVIHFGPY